MRKMLVFAACLFAGLPLLFAGPTESRTWTATNGKKVEGKVISIQGAKATLEIKAEVPKESAGRMVDALTDLVRPWSEARGLRADMIRLHREDVALQIA